MKCLSAVLLLAASNEARLGSEPTSRKLRDSHPNAEVLPSQYIVTLINGTSAASFEDMVSGYGAAITHEYNATFPGFSIANATEELLAALELEGAVERIDPVSC